MRLIDADALKKPLEVAVKESGFYSPMYKSFLKNIESAPTIDAEPVRHGHWIAYEDETMICATEFVCSACRESFCSSELTDKEFYEMMKHCPNCGAKMDEVSE